MILFDAFALVALTRDEPSAEQVSALLADDTQPRAISALNLAEVIDKLVRGLGFPSAEVSAGLTVLRLGGLDVLFIDDVIAEDAAILRARHYHRSRAPLSMADCVALATARHESARIATADQVLTDAARAEGLDVIELAA